MNHVLKKIILSLTTLLFLTGCGNIEGSERLTTEALKKNPEISKKALALSEKTLTMPKNFSNMDADVFEKLMHSNQYITIDIRTPQEIAQGKILKNALEMDFYAENFSAELEKLDKTKNYLIYCRSANRTGNTLLVMQQMGFKTVYDLEGGISDWVRSGKKLHQ